MELLKLDGCTTAELLLILKDMYKDISENGVFFTSKGEWGASVQYDKNDLVSFEGSAYLSTVANIGYQPGIGDKWQLISQRGKQGEQGVSGKDGSDGAPGRDGAEGRPGNPGLDGAPGRPGAPGVSPTVEVGNTTTLEPGHSATVTNSGQGSLTRLNFGIPRGEVGVSASMAIDNVVTLPPDTPAYVINKSGTPSHGLFEFGIPKGATGASGDGTTLVSLEVYKTTKGIAVGQSFYYFEPNGKFNRQPVIGEFVNVIIESTETGFGSLYNCYCEIKTDVEFYIVSFVTMNNPTILYPSQVDFKTTFITFRFINIIGSETYLFNAVFSIGSDLPATIVEISGRITPIGSSQFLKCVVMKTDGTITATRLGYTISGDIITVSYQPKVDKTYVECASTLTRIARK